jgi:hypothetical protein
MQIPGSNEYPEYPGNRFIHILIKRGQAAAIQKIVPKHIKIIYEA